MMKSYLPFGAAAAVLLAVGAFSLPAAVSVDAAQTSHASKTKRKTSKSKVRAPKIVWRTSFKTAMAEAKRTGKPMMVDFYAEWCGPCKMLDSMTWPDAKVARAARGFIAVKVDTDKEQDLSRQYGITGLPTVMFFNTRGQAVTNFVGFREPKEAAALIEAAYARAAKRPNVVTASLR